MVSRMYRIAWECCFSLWSFLGLTDWRLWLTHVRFFLSLSLILLALYVYRTLLSWVSEFHFWWNVVPAEKSIVRRERSSGTYNVSAYISGKMLAELPLDLFFPILFSCIAYYMIGLNVRFLLLLVSLSSLDTVWLLSWFVQLPCAVLSLSLLLLTSIPTCVLRSYLWFYVLLTLCFSPLSSLSAPINSPGLSTFSFSTLSSFWPRWRQQVSVYWLALSRPQPPLPLSLHLCCWCYWCCLAGFTLTARIFPYVSFPFVCVSCVRTFVSACFYFRCS